MNKYRLLLTMLIALLLVCCSSENGGGDAPATITLDDNQPSTITCAADAVGGTIAFNASGRWSASVRAENDGKSVDWLSLNEQFGNASAHQLKFGLTYNDTHSARAAYIDISCRDSRVTVKVIQNAISDNSNIPQSGETIMIEYSRYIVDGEGEKLAAMSSSTIRYDEGRVATIETTPDEKSEFIWASDHVQVAKSGSEHYGELAYGRIVGGWYRTAGGADKIPYVYTYNSDGYIRQTMFGVSDDDWTTYSFSWAEDNLSKIVCADGASVEFFYDERSVKNIFGVDAVWLLTTGLSVCGGAVGDPSRTFAVLGMLGHRSAMLPAKIVQTTELGVITYTVAYATTGTSVLHTTVNRYDGEAITERVEWKISNNLEK